MADPRSIVSGEAYRFTALTELLIRMEYSSKGEFTSAIRELLLA